MHASRDLSVHVYRRFLGGFGGGQLYTLAIAQALSEAGYDVSCGSVDEVDATTAAQSSGLELEGVRFVRHEDESQVDFDGDLLIHVANADLALPAVKAGRRVAVVFLPTRLHRARDAVRVARNRVAGRNGYDWVGSRLARYDAFWSISAFTQTVLSRRWRRESRLLKPPLLQAPDASPLSVMSRRPEVLVLGRLSPEKQLPEVIDAFANSTLSETHALRIMGERSPSDAYADRVIAAAEKTNAEVVLSAPRTAVLDALAQARFLWHGMGIGVSPTRHPELVEQFGMVVLEAMAWGCIPLAADRGGPAELLPPRLQVAAFGDLAGVTAGIEALAPAEVDAVQGELVARAADYRWSRFATAASSLVDDLIERW